MDASSILYVYNSRHTTTFNNCRMKKVGERQQSTTINSDSLNLWFNFCVIYKLFKLLKFTYFRKESSRNCFVVIGQKQ